MVTRGQFTVNGEPDAIFDTLVGACGELKAKIADADTLRHEVSGKSKTTGWRWGTKFRARLVKNAFDVKVEIYDLSVVPDDRFIKELHKMFLKYLPASQLTIDTVKQIMEIKNEVDEYVNDSAPMPAEGQPLTTADIPDDAGRKVLPAEKICGRCGAPNPSDSKYCNKCSQSLAACPNCGYISKEESSFCIKCGTKLD
jgi:hypothetical protein